MQIKTTTYNVAAIVGRFQTDTLHQAHKDLIQTVLNNHPKVLIFLGVSPTKGTINNPLPFAPRRQMILETFPHDKYPNLYVGYISDLPSDEEWSKRLDTLVKEQLEAGEKAVLYGSRESFLGAYKGKLPTLELVSESQISGTEIRKRISEVPQSHPMFRAGAIWAAYQRYPVAFGTVDIAVVNKKDGQILMARKESEKKYRFVGGFADPESDSYEDDARRELSEETGLTVASLKYVGSKKINDWRYKGEKDKIKTHLYIGYYTHGCARPNDDIFETRWFQFDEIDLSLVEPIHHDIYRMVAVYLKENDGLELRIEPKEKILTA